MREAEEKIGLPATAIAVLAELLPVHTRRSGFQITSFLARISPPPTWRFDPIEPAEALQVPVRHLADLALA